MSATGTGTRLEAESSRGKLTANGTKEELYSGEYGGTRVALAAYVRP